jgi:peptidoglycan/xylan/chitin deacetylase (PgdA/CDA1 family)
MPQTELRWPNGSRIAVAVTAMLESWPEGKAPTYTVSTSTLNPGTVDLAGHAWSTFGGRVGVWRIIRTLDRHNVPATFAVNARSAELYPEAVRQMVESGHDVCGHNYTQDQVLSNMGPEEEQATIRKCLAILAETSGVQPTGWLSSVGQFTENTVAFLAGEGLAWHSDVTYTDLPHRIMTAHGPIAAVPNTDFTDNRVLRGSPRDFFDAYKSAFDYLYQNEPMSMLVITLHCQFGGRPLIISVFEQVLQYIARFPGVWWASHAELGRWALEAKADDHPYQTRFFTEGPDRPL